MTPPRPSCSASQLLKGVAISFLLLSASSPAVEEEEVTVQRAPVASWVEPIGVPMDPGEPPEEVSDGLWHLLVDEQYHVPREERYGHYARLFLNEEGVQNGASVKIDFDPRYETLTLNRLSIHRDGEKLDRLTEQPVQLLHREEDMENHLYDGRLSAVLVLEDIRSGDLLEFAYTIKGRNPIFDGHFVKGLSLSWSVPLRQLQYRVLWPEDRTLAWRSHGSGDALEPEVAAPEGGLQEYRWALKDMVPVRSDGGVPSWHDPWPWLQLSEYADWTDVSGWASELYQVPEKLPEALAHEVERIRKLETNDERILAAVRWVQDNVRYLGMFMGAHSYQPYPLEVVLRRRFGDCKDKTLMLCTILRALDYDASPALVHTSYRQKVDDLLASPLAFDHLVTRLHLDGETYWIDPTRSNQRGKISELYFPDYGTALVAATETKGLEQIEPASQGVNEVDVHESIRMRDYQGDAEMRVRTTYRGRQADRIRTVLKNTSRKELGRNYLSHYQNRYPDLEMVGMPEFQDNVAKNEIVADERYRITGLWKERKNRSNRLYASFYPQIVRSEVSKPDKSERTMPYGIDHPVRVNQEIEVVFPDSADFDTERIEVDDPAFSFLYTSNSVDRKLLLKYSFETLADHVAASRMPEYAENVDGIFEYLGYEIWISDDMARHEPDYFAQSKKEEVPEVVVEAGFVPSMRSGVVAVSFIWLMALAGALGWWLFARARSETV